MVYGLLRDMNGRIEVENRGGAVFTITLPACPRPGPVHEESP